MVEDPVRYLPVHVPEPVLRLEPDSRCDRCNVAAKLRILVTGGGDLVFCGHHANAYAENLLRIVVDVAVEPGFEWRGAPMLAARMAEEADEENERVAQAANEAAA
jgi:hypothetical protein